MKNVLALFDPKYIASDGKQIALNNFLVGEAKLVIWVKWKIKLKGEGVAEPEAVLKPLIVARIRADVCEKLQHKTWLDVTAMYLKLLWNLLNHCNKSQKLHLGHKLNTLFQQCKYK